MLANELPELGLKEREPEPEPKFKPPEPAPWAPARPPVAVLRSILASATDGASTLANRAPSQHPAETGVLRLHAHLGTRDA